MSKADLIQRAIEPVADHRPLGWAGLLLPVPASYRPLKIQGDARKGMIVLGDEHRARLELRWADVTRKKFDSQTYARKHLKRWVGKARAGEVEEHARPLDNPGFDPLLRLPDEQAKMDRLTGYAPQARRVLDIAYHHGTAAEDRAMREISLARLVDQPADQPCRWAFFDHSFITPGGLRYRNATLNIGDMRVTATLRPREHAGPSVTVRQIYPATMALKRQKLADWMHMLVEDKQLRQLYVPKLRRRDRKQRNYCTRETPRGPALECPLRLRYGVRLVLWRTPRLMRTLLVHDQERNRLIAIQTAMKAPEHGPVIEEVLDGLHWAKPLDAEASE